MLNMAVVEDNSADKNEIVGYIEKYSQSKNVALRTECFVDGVTFLTNYNPIYDVVFLDIQMPFMNGMDVAQKLREKDENVPIVFITNMANFAVKGYSVNAVDFIIKPISYFGFSVMMDKLLRIVKAKAETIILKTSEGAKKVYINSIRYIEINDHKITYHTSEGDVIVWGSLKIEEEKLPLDLFERCNNCFLINLMHVEEVVGNDILIGKIKVPVSRAKKPQFMQKLLKYFSEHR